MKKSVLCLAIAFSLYGCDSNKDISYCPKGTSEKIVKNNTECVIDNNLNVEIVKLPVLDIEQEKFSSKKGLVVTQENLKQNTISESLMLENNNIINKIKIDKNTIDNKIKEPKKLEFSVVVKKGDSIISILKDNNINSNFFYSLEKGKQKILSNIKVGEKILFKIKENNDVVYIKKRISALDTLVLKNNNEKYDISHEIKKPIISTKVFSFNIKNSLYVDGKKEGLSDYTILSVLKILGEKIDFVYSIRKNDKFSIVVDRPTYDNKLVGKPKIRAIRIDSKVNGEIYAIKFKNQNGDIGYYDENGQSVKTGFLRTPVDFSRISSGFQLKRKHPVLGYTRAHKGTDFAAPTGTPIHASSDGKVILSTKGRGYGNVVYLDHGHGITTRYAHMNRRSVKKGEWVKQGQTLGYVGSTGYATGPHLHYEFRVNGEPVNAMTVKLPTADPVRKNEMDRFRSISSNMIAALSPYSSNKDLYVANTNNNEQNKNIN